MSKRKAVFRNGFYNILCSISSYGCGHYPECDCGQGLGGTKAWVERMNAAHEEWMQKEEEAWCVMTDEQRAVALEQMKEISARWELFRAAERGMTTVEFGTRGPE